MLSLITRRFPTSEASPIQQNSAVRAPAALSFFNQSSDSLDRSYSSSSLASSTVTHISQESSADSVTTVTSSDSVYTPSLASNEMTGNTTKMDKNLENLASIQVALTKVSKIQDKEQRKQLTAEILSKAYVYSRPELNSVVLLPVGDGDNENNLVPYQFIPVDIQNGMPLFLLSAINDPEKNPPFLIFKGTSPNNFSSVYNDLSVSAILHGIGTPAFTKSKKALETILTALNMAHPNNKPIVCGHSLGGALAQLTAVHFNDLVQECYGFNSPKVSKETAKKWFSLPIESRPKISVINTKGDVVSEKAGYEKIGTHYVVEPDQPLRSIKDKHAKTVLNAPHTASIEDFNNPKIPTGFFGNSAYYTREFFSLIATVMKVALSFLIIEPMQIIIERRNEKKSNASDLKGQQLEISSETTERIFQQKTGLAHWVDVYEDENWHTPDTRSMADNWSSLRELLIAYANEWWQIPMTENQPIESKSFDYKDNLKRKPAEAVFCHCREYGSKAAKGYLFDDLFKKSEESRQELVKKLKDLPAKERDEACEYAFNWLTAVDASDEELREVRVLQCLASVSEETN